MRRLSFLPVPVLIVLMVTVYFTVPSSVFYDPPWLILTGNTLFVGVVCGLVGYIALRNYRTTGRIQILLLGAGVLIFGIGGVAAAVVRGIPEAGPNLNVTIYNSGALVGALFHFVAAFVLIAGLSPELGSTRRQRWLGLAYVGSISFMALVTVASLNDLFPTFFIQGVGPTPLRQIVLGTADILFVFAFFIFLGTYLRNREVFLYWYSCALALTAISLTAFFIQSSVGSPLGWVGRFSQYLGGIYFLVALLRAARSAQSRGTSLDDVLTRSLSGIEEKFRALAENAPDVIRRFDADLHHIYVNPAGLALLRRPAAAVIGKDLEEVGISKEQARVWKERIQTVFRTGERMEVSDEFPTDQGIRFYQSHCVPEYGPDGRVANVLVVSRNLTDWKRAEAALRESEARFRSMADGAPVIIWISDAAARNLFVNRAYREFFNVKLEEVEATAWRPVVHPDDVDEYYNALRDAVREHTAFRTEARVRRADGEWRWLSSYGEPRFSSEGEFLGHAGISMDVTDARRGDEALREADRRKNEFLAVLSHELRNPLAPIRFALPVLQGERLSEPAARALAVIDRQTESLTRLVEDLLDVSRITRGDMELRRTHVTLGSVIAAAVEAASPAIKTANHELTVTVPDDPVWVDGDPARLAQVVTNLLNNSAKYTARSGHIAVDARRDGASAVIRVKDNGIGIPAEALTTVFDMFRRVGHEQITDTGLGIGLALTKRLVDMHNGTIEAQSAGSGRGLEFIVRLPAIRDEDARPAVAPIRRGRSSLCARRLKVLIVDDSPDVVEMLAELVRGLGHDVRMAADGRVAVETALEYCPEVVLLDLGLPGMSGIEVARELRRHESLKYLRLIALTGWGQDEYRRQTQEAGFDCHLTKPADPATLEMLLADFAALERRPEQSPGPIVIT